jgi:acetyl-CoA carboxylase carboxyl transferase subunit beta
MAWFQRKDKGIQTPTEAKRDTPKGLWYKSPTGKVIETDELEKNFYVSPEDGYHVRIGSKEYFKMLFDNNKFTELDSKITSKDPLKFTDKKGYMDRLKTAQSKTNLNDAIRTAVGKSKGRKIVIACMVISKSGGARMMEAALSLMQLAKTSAKLAQLAEANIPYISLCTDPTTGGTTASFAMLGDINISEPGALIGFAGPRVVRDTTGKELPKGFQTAEFVMEHGFLDFITQRKELKNKVNQYIDLILNLPLRA